MNCGKKNPVHKTAGGAESLEQYFWKENNNCTSICKPGSGKARTDFIFSSGGGFGHTGLVESVNGGFLETIEGNTNEGGSREGIGVFRRNRRKIKDINRGFIHY
ncbi:MAG: CHAP domain-containing protein [Ignavibacteria bacterium]|nr:CHAP domain-containing protein [Ignavibacteria bacterium]